MTFDPHGNPIPPSRDHRALIPLFTGLMLLAGFTMAGWALINEYRQPLPSAGAGTPAAAERPPVELMSIAQSLATMVASPAPDTIAMVTHTPEPKPPRPRSTMPSGPAPCPADPNVLPDGTLCKGVAPEATSTPYPTCTSPATPGPVCQVRNSRTVQTPPPSVR